MHNIRLIQTSWSLEAGSRALINMLEIDHEFKLSPSSTQPSSEMFEELPKKNEIQFRETYPILKKKEKKTGTHFIFFPADVLWSKYCFCHMQHKACERCKEF